MSKGLDIPVQFGGVSIGESTARLSMRIPKESLNIVAADEAFCERRLNGRVVLGKSDDSPGQSKMFETDVAVEATFDIHRFGVSAENYTTGATFKLKEIEVGELARFSKGAGRLVVDSIDVIPTDVVEEEDDDTDSTLPGTFTTDEPWREVSLDTLFSGAILKAMKGAGLSTVGDMHDYQQPSKNGHVNQIGDIKGLGPAKVQQVEDRMLEFWRDNPQGSSE